MDQNGVQPSLDKLVPPLWMCAAWIWGHMCKISFILLMSKLAFIEVLAHNDPQLAVKLDGGIIAYGLVGCSSSPNICVAPKGQSLCVPNMKEKSYDQIMKEDPALIFVFEKFLKYL